MTMSGRQLLHLYAIGIGSNRPLSRALTPHALVRMAMVALDLPPLNVIARSPIITSRPLGPSQRRYANAAVLVASPLPPLVMLERLQAIETRFGRKRHRRWGARTIDLDILQWSGGMLHSRWLNIPHPAMATRHFVLEPLKAIAPQWRDPASGLSIRQLATRLGKAKPVVDRKGKRH